MPTAKEVLAREVWQRAEWIRNDCHTFFRTRHDKLGTFVEPGKTSTEPMGGGNFLMLTGQMNLLGFLAKVYLHLADPNSFTTESDIDDARKAKDELLQLIPVAKTELKKALKESWKTPRIGECNEEVAFAKLIAGMTGVVNLGLGKKEAAEVWKLFRNNLTHMACPGGRVVAYLLPLPSALAEYAVTGVDPPFRFDPQKAVWSCYVDRLNLDIVRIADWLGGEIHQCRHDDRILAAIRWMGVEDLLVASAEA